MIPIDSSVGQRSSLLSYVRDGGHKCFRNISCYDFSCVDSEGTFSELHKTMIGRQTNLGSSSKVGVSLATSPDKQNLGTTCFK